MGGENTQKKKKQSGQVRLAYGRGSVILSEICAVLQEMWPWKG